MKVNEIFYSLQGEGRFTGVPAVFVRLSGCNMHCWFCDTSHEEGTQMSVEEIVSQVLSFPARHVVITGGEPALQLDKELSDALHKAGFFIQIETNGTVPLKEGVSVDWITCSPKVGVREADGVVRERALRLGRIDELKVVMDSEDMDPSRFEEVKASEYRLQPCATGDPAKDKRILKATIEYIQAHPQWSLSLQTHKMLDIR